MPRIGEENIDLSRLTERQLTTLPNESLRFVAQELLKMQQEDRRENNLLYYRPAHDACWQVHESEAKVMAVGGGNGCLPLDAPVLMADGSWKELGQIVEGDVVMGADPGTGATEPSRVTTVWRSGQKPVYRIEYSDGGYFEATAEHMVPMYLGSGRKTSKGNLKSPRKRRLGDYIEPIMRRGRTNPSKRISCVSPLNIQAGQERLPLHPYLLGALIGDGGLSRPHPKFTNVDPLIIERVDGHLRAIGCHLVKYDALNFGITNIGQSGNRRADGFEPNRLSVILEDLGLKGLTSHHKFIPEVCFGLDREARKQLLAGLVDTDGTLDFFATASLDLAEGFERLVRSLGGKASLCPRKSSVVVGGPIFHSWAVYWRMNERIPLCLARKQAVNQRGKEIDYRRRICRKAGLIGMRECGDIEVDHPSHCYITRDYTIVSNSSKTETTIAHLMMLATGIIPNEPRIRKAMLPKFKGPVKIRIVVESLTTVLHPIILPKLKWWVWTGLHPQGGDRGHWGWIPKTSLKGGSWEKSWSEKLRTLTVLCRDPEDPDKVVGESSIQFMSHDQDPSDFASGDFDHVLHDEPPSYAIWTENQARTMRVNGVMYLAMTWPDDPSIPVDWIFDEVYEKGRDGPNKAPDVEWIELDTQKNPHLDQAAISAQMAKWSHEMRTVRIKGQPIRFSNRIHPLFTDLDTWWCFTCGRVIVPVGDKCDCGSSDICEFNHVRDFETARNWPGVFVLDPHPRKPHMFLWALVDPSDDIWVVQDGAMDDEPAEIRGFVEDMEESLGIDATARLIDPNMGRSPASARRSVTWQDEFDAAGLMCDLADDSDVGRGRINEYLKPDPHTLRPRIHVHPRCQQTIHQMKRYVWDEHRKKQEKDLKQKPRDKYDDYPTMLKYLMNFEPGFGFLHRGAPVVVRSGHRKGAY